MNHGIAFLRPRDDPNAEQEASESLFAAALECSRWKWSASRNAALRQREREEVIGWAVMDEVLTLGSSRSYHRKYLVRRSKGEHIVQCTCHVCGVRFSRETGRMKRVNKNGTFCSRACYYAFQRGKSKPRRPK